MLLDAIYLDHAGTALYSKSLIERFTADMLSNLYGNPHSASVSSQLSTNRIEDTRLKVLRFFNADPEEFDLVFVANATAGIKLVADAFRNVNHGFNYIYHKDAHTSLVGVRELAKSSRCLDDGDIEEWLSSEEQSKSEQDMFNLFAYPAQSNMDGRRLPMSWLHRARSIGTSVQSMTYTLLDASAFVSTSPLDLGNPTMAADFTVLSFYKIFGFPDLGGLIIRKSAGAVFKHRGYFGGGTVDIVLCVKEQWHVSKTEALHESLEDGTLPTHQIVALDVAIDVHRELYGSMISISRHANFLAKRLYDGLSSINHFNFEPVCVIHSSGFDHANSAHIQGPTIAFNLKNCDGAWVSNTEFERLASVRGFHIRSGGLCNPGGIATCLKLEPWEMKENFSAGMRCGAEPMVHTGKITGVLRASVGAMSTIKDVDAFISFVQEFYAEKDATSTVAYSPLNNSTSQLLVESLMIYPIKSCGGLNIPPNTDWELRPEGLVWDREWCLVHQGTGQALSQKRHPRMALIRPEIDVETGALHVKYHGARPLGVPEHISIPLSADPAFFGLFDGNKPIQSRVCGDPIVANTYAKPEINEYFSTILGVPCALARFPAGGSGHSTRHAKAHMQKHQRPERTSVKGNQENEPYGSLPTPPDSDSEVPIRPILLSNESPILAINRASLNALNRQIVETGGKPASSSVFRANIVIGSSNTRDEEPYDEDHWTTLHIGRQKFQMLGSCRRCHMICVDQDTAEKNEEPFLSLAKTRRFDSKIFFGSHMCHVPSRGGSKESQFPTIRVGDIVTLGVGDD